MAGNVGTQSLAVTIRVLMDEQLKAGDKLKLIVKEMSIGGINGLVLGFFSLVGIGAYIYFFKHMPLHISIGICLLYRHFPTTGYGHLLLCGNHRPYLL